MSARFVAGGRTRVARVLLALLGIFLPCILAAVGALLAPTDFLWSSVVPFFAPIVTAIALSRQFAPRARNASFAIRPGAVVERGRFGLAMRARDVIGMTTCAHEDGYALSVLMRNTRAPHTLIVRDASTLERLRAALGGGHDGTGAVTWPTWRDPRESVLMIVSMAFAVTYYLQWVAVLLSIAWPFLKAFPRSPEKLQSIALREKGLMWKAAYEAFFPYADIAHAEYDRRAKALVLLAKTGQRVNIPTPRMGAVNGEIIVSQINAAVLRAGGARAVKADDARDRASLLHRSSDEPVRAWLARLDGLAASLVGSDYRSAALSKDDLLRIAEDPDASFEQRAGAARVLVRALGPDERPRVADALANVRAEEKHARVVLEDDVDAAAEAIALESATEEARRTLKA